MSSKPYTSALGSLNESSSTKYSLEQYIQEQTISNKNNICYDSSEISLEDSSDEELITYCKYKLVTVACWKHPQKVFVVLKCLKSLPRYLTLYIWLSQKEQKIKRH